MRLEIITCNVIYVPKTKDKLVVLDTSKERLEAGTLLPDLDQKKDRLTASGTYLAQHLVGAVLLDTWEPERVANAAANTFFRDNPDQHAQFFERYIKSLQEAAKHEPFIID